MMFPIRKAGLLALSLATTVTVSTVPAYGQAATRSGLSFEGTSDLRERGLGWSNGEAALVVDGTLAVTNNLSLEASAATLRGSERHGDSDLGLTFGPRISAVAAGWSLSAGLTGRVFTGEGSLDYVEIDGSAARSIGPAQIGIGVSFAPSQDAIGGENLYLHADAAVGVPGTPLTVYGGVGHTTGSSSDDPRAARLRPGGEYTDYYIGVERVQNNLALGLRYTDTSVDNDRGLSPYADRHDGSRVSAYVRFTP